MNKKHYAFFMLWPCVNTIIKKKKNQFSLIYLQSILIFFLILCSKEKSQTDYSLSLFLGHKPTFSLNSFKQIMCLWCKRWLKP